MTPDQFTAEYLRREKAAHATPQGADCKAILTELAEEHGLTYQDARAAVLNHTIMGAN